MGTVAKELFIMALLLMIVVFMIGMVFYEYMPNNKTVPEPIAYTTDSSTAAVLQEISADATQSGTSTDLSTQSIIKSYSIGAKELSTAASKQSYTSGKTDPFAEYKEPTNTNTNSATGEAGATGNTSTTTTNASTVQQNSSSGTFFENGNTK